MKRFKKVICILLSLILLLSLAACGSKQTDEPVNTPPDTENETPVDPDPADPETPAAQMPYDKYPAKDLDGRKIVVAANYLLVPDSRDPEPDPSEDNYFEKKAKWDNLKRIEAKYNVTIEALNIPWEEITPQLTSSVLAGTPVADVILLAGDQVLNAVNNNQLLPVKDYAPANADILNDNEVLLPGGEVMGDEYFMKDRNVPVEGMFMGVNLDIINSLGAENPVDLFNADNWTYDKFLELCRLATKDTDGDGKIDQYGYSGVIQPLAVNLVAANDGVLFDEENLTHGFDNPKTMKALEMIQKMYNEDKVVYIYDNNLWDWNGNTDSYKEGKSAFFLLQTWMVPAGDDRLPYEYTIVPFPKGPDNTTGVSFFLGSGGMAIPRGVEDPTDVYIILEELMAWFGDDFSAKSDGTMEWLEQRYLTEEDVERTIYISEKLGKIDNNGTISGFPVGDIVGPIADGSMTVAQSVEANKQLAQDAINKLFNQE